MLMMRLQRVGRKNDPSFRIVVTDKRTGVKSDKHIDRLGSYNPKMNHIQIDVEKAKEWLSKGVQPSDTMHNLLVSQKVIEGKKINVLPKKSPIVSESTEEETVTEEAATSESESADTEETAAPTDEASAEETPDTTETTKEVADATETAPDKAEEVKEEEKK